MSIVIAGSASTGGGTTAAVNVSEGGNPGYFSPVDPSFSLIQIGWTVVGHPELGTVTNVVYVPDSYAAVTTSSGNFNIFTSYAFTSGSGGSDGVTITGGVTILQV
jgi:hypothetical protein